MTELPDRSLCVLAQLMVDQKDGRGGLGSYGPFISHCLARQGDPVVSAPAVQEQLKSEWGLDLPQGVINEVLRTMIPSGLVSVDHGAFKPNADMLRECDLGEAQATAEGHGAS